MASLLCKPQFFFMKNASVLKTARSIPVGKVLLNQKPLLMNKLSTGLISKSKINQISFKRSFSSLRSLKQEVKVEIPKNIPKRQVINSSNLVGYWLMGTSVLVFGIVILGGLTRLTESGLSITEWKPVTGAIPPLTQEEWELEFAKYKESPEFQQLNSHISLDEFKFIFFMEWFHRLWGRTIGVAMLLPAAYFAFTKKTSPRMNRKIFVLLLLLGLQGAIGWWMVKSGLDQEQLDERKSKPTVSQYRLTTHLAAAFVLYSAMIWSGLEILRENKWIKNPKEALELFQQLDNPALKRLRGISVFLVGLTFLTAMSGGMVAGLDAGLIYNTFPHMGSEIIPSKRELFDDTYARKEDLSDKFWRNMLENPATVQLNHRILATTTFFAVLATHLYASRIKSIVPKSANSALHGVMGMVSLQVALGITTLIYLVPIPLASAHQAGALALLTSALIFASKLRKPRVPIRVLTSSVYAQMLKKSKV